MDEPLHIGDDRTLLPAQPLAAVRLYLARDKNEKRWLLAVLGATKAAAFVDPSRYGDALDAQRATVRSLARHRGIAPMIAVRADVPTAAYPCGDGVLLSTWLTKRSQRVEPSAALAFCISLLEVLAFTHRRGIAHGAVDSSLLTVARQGRLRLQHVLGFGLREATGGAVSPQDDVHGAGLLLYRLVCGREAPTIDGAGHVDLAAVERELQTTGGAGPGLRACVMKALAHRSTSKYANAQQFSDALSREIRRNTRDLPGVMTTRSHFLSKANTITHPFAADRPTDGVLSESPRSGRRRHRAWKAGQALAVNVQPTREDQAKSPAPARGFPWRTLLVAWVAALCLGGAALWVWRSQSTSASNVDTSEVATSLTPPQHCEWTHVVRAMERGDMDIELGNDHKLVLSYDRMAVNVQISDGSTLRPVRRIRAFGNLEVFERRLPVSGRDWLILLPKVRNTQRPLMWVLQFKDGRLITANSVALSSSTASSALIQLHATADRCLLSVRVLGDTGGGPTTKEIRLRMVDPGLVVESGAIGDLWAPPLSDSPL